MHSTTSQMSTRDRIGAILRVTSGNFLEQFDFFLFGFYATYIAHTFFPASSEFASLMMTFAVFGAGFLMRPIGAIVLGAYIDKVGRRKGLIVTLSIMATGTFLIVLIPSYQTIGLWAPLLVAISNFFWLPVGGALSDRFGRRSVLIAMTLLALATAWPALTMLANAPSFLMMLSVLLWLSFIYGMYNGAMIPALTEIMPAEVRVAGFSLAYSLATAVFGGFTPVISTALIEYTGDKASPGYWMSFAAICGLLATCYLYRRSAVALQTAR
ncbi:TPA: MFS transporter [Klebsiella pneumoniae]